jgi:3-deoxy-manno-octulosonate cytidylyltransferase (CMP-KDO synthetase)
VPKAIGIIPARYQSNRFPGKALAPLGGVPLVVRVYRSAAKSNLLKEVYVATDDARIKSVVEEFGGNVILTSSEHATGSDRVAEAARGIPDADPVVNIQGDEPFITGEVIDKVVAALDDPDIVMSTACSSFSDLGDADNPNVVKVVLDRNGFALYFSRSRIPFDRAGHAGMSNTYRHLGIYGFRRDFLMTFSALKRTALEKTEGLEQLRALEHGYRIKTEVFEIDFPGIDSEEDLARAEGLLLEMEGHDG